MRDHLSKAEISKDAVQATVEAAAHTVGQVASIITTAVQDVATAIGGFATELYEIRDASRRAAEEHGEPTEGPTDVADTAPGSAE
jgi:ABC-type transporter Mla subunit MlaD